MGSVGLVAPAGAVDDAIGPNKLVVVFDGRTVLNVEQAFYPASPETAAVGITPYASTAAQHLFTGTILSARLVGAEAVPRDARSGSYGAIEMSVVFPYWVPGTQEPLVVTGRTGAGDFVYVRYVDISHVSFGFDHWGIGGLTSKPIAMDFSRTHRIAITFQSLYRETSPSTGRRR